MIYVTAVYLTAVYFSAIYLRLDLAKLKVVSMQEKKYLSKFLFVQIEIFYKLSYTCTKFDFLNPATQPTFLRRSQILNLAKLKIVYMQEKNVFSKAPI